MSIRALADENKQNKERKTKSDRGTRWKLKKKENEY